ncbi:MAG: DNA polymerase III subunit delta, partial [Rhodospirillales bacterium]|nr:DNA polymerase III subunit delta [Rhodospirillales bacterium]
MKVSASQAERFVRTPDPKIRGILVYGPDAGLVRERAEALARSVVEDPRDPFRVADLTARQLEADPARLADEAAALALTGGRRVVRVGEAGDAVSGLMKSFLANPAGDALVVVQAGELPARSSLRKVFESAELGAAVACYRDDQRSLSAVITAMLADQGLTTTPEAMAYLSANLGGDRQLTRREMEKLILYKGGSGGAVDLDEAVACVGDSAALTLDDLALAVAGGDLAGLERTLLRSLEAGSSPVAVLRAVARHFQRLHIAAGSIATGLSPGDAVRRLRPPVFWKMADRFTAQCTAWSPRPL